MGAYTYKATDSAGVIYKGVLDAESEKEVVVKLHDMGYIPIRITASGGSGAGVLNFDIGSRFGMLLRRVATKDVMLFTQDLATLLEAGLPVDRALSVLIDVAEKKQLKDIIADVLKAVQGGSYLSDALAKYPRAFSDFYVNMIRAGEAGGVLEAVLIRLGEFLESSQELQDYIKSALVYPVFLLLVGGVSIIVLLTFVIPKFSIIFSDMGQTLPLSTAILLAFSQYARQFWWVGVIVVGLAVYGYRRFRGRPEGRLKIDQLSMRIPMVGHLVKMVEVARFARTLGTLIKSGVPILEALRLVTEIIGNKVVAGSLALVYDRVKEGDRLSSPLAAAGIFPSLAIQMITVGEETGRLDQMLLKVADNYEKTVRNLVKRLISFLEPAMILLMGLVVGFIVISMLMAIFSLNDMPF